MAQVFRILWFEDQLREISSQRAELVEQALEDHGIALTFEDRPVAHDDVLEEVKRRQLLYHDFDFVVLDYDLGGEVTGDVVAARLREDFGFVPMVFYSGNLDGVRGLRGQLLEAGVDGIHCVERRNLVEFLGEKLDELLHPVSRIEAVRGSAVGALAECDIELRRWFVARCDEIDEEAKVKIESRLDANLAESNSSRDKQWEKRGGDLPWKVERADSSHLMRITRTLAGTLGIDGLPEHEAFHKDLLEPRNILGHAVAERTADGLVVRSLHGGEIKPQELADLRRRMAQTREAILRFAVPKEPE
ncbi:response regulator [Aurantimonas marianensis]|uniref:Response regulator n=1 Tax=Aurantimonas marianensis TaxID=2920428 RepID=A0A9X2HEL2_9HYPH|nr:response regulator [Aurantimonas marianensis]MCP3056209.1 response regulator [Aurantimonas marianensis]